MSTHHHRGPVEIVVLRGRSLAGPGRFHPQDHRRARDRPEAGHRRAMPVRPVPPQTVLRRHPQNRRPGASHPRHLGARRRHQHRVDHSASLSIRDATHWCRAPRIRADAPRRDVPGRGNTPHRRAPPGLVRVGGAERPAQVMCRDLLVYRVSLHMLVIEGSRVGCTAESAKTVA